ncbi:glycosyltransferase family protein [Nocardioides sambongensis]|uniref:glycosyltransferase n=1 Tax=Nocardioides sambongensis TaxID=2589074 RepID=UPI0015E861EA|nr:glycosyltransferase [Nocardioides sambongensis]
MRVAILANDVVPGMGMPVAAPGLRAWGMAEGLRELGCEVVVIIEPGLAGSVWGRALPPPTPSGAIALRPTRIAEYVRAQSIDALVICNSNHAPALGDLGRCRLIYDFFAPKVLEMSENVARDDLEEALWQLRVRKSAALARSDAVVSNGAKKLPYVREWMERSGVPDLPLAVVNPGVPPMPPAPRRDGPLRAIATGYLQPWSRPGAWTSAVLPLLDEGILTLDLLVARHWGQRVTREETPQELSRLFEHPAVTSHQSLRFGDFRALMSGFDLSLDIFARNPERELAMVTRSVVALAGGLPVLHPPFTEVSPIIRQYGAGWLVQGDDAAEMTDVLRGIGEDEAALKSARDGAVRVSHEVFAPAVAAAPLQQLLEELL